MIEVTFTESAGGSMKYAKSRKHTIGTAVTAVFLAPEGEQPTEEEIRAAQAEAEERERRRREEAIPFEGDPRDVVTLPLGLGMGDISAPFSDKRAAYLQSMVGIRGRQFENVGADMMNTAREGLARIQRAVQNGEPIRAWYSDQPDECCGFYHLMSLLDDRDDIRAVKLPRFEEQGNTVTTHNGWGDVDPGKLAGYLPLEQTISPLLRRCFYASRWRELCRENAPLRAMVNGRLTGVPADFYDHIILRELERMEDEFMGARLVGNVLGRHQLGIGDWLIGQRLEEFISRGILEPAGEAREDVPGYYRRMRKGGTVCGI